MYGHDVKRHRVARVVSQADQQSCVDWHTAC